MNGEHPILLPKTKLRSGIQLQAYSEPLGVSKKPILKNGYRHVAKQVRTKVLLEKANYFEHFRVFDAEIYEFDRDLQQYIPMTLPTQTWKREAQSAWIRRP